jgi:hypothetical protein
MADTNARLSLDQPATYHIRVQGELDEDWRDWFEGMAITVERGVTVLTGTIADQSALHGLLTKILNLGLPLLLVKRVEEALPGGE